MARNTHVLSTWSTSAIVIVLNEEVMKFLIVLALVAIGMTSTLALAQHDGMAGQNRADGGHIGMSPQGMTMRADGGMDMKHMDMKDAPQQRR